jgi:hypothetical protein
MSIRFSAPIRTLLLVFTLSGAIACANPLKVIESDTALLTQLPNLQNSKIAFIDLSATKSGPKITITNLNGDFLESFLIPSDRYSPEWTNWGPGISYDNNSHALWFLSPQIGLTQFRSNGDVLKKIDFPKSSHQIQITPEGTLVLPFSWDTAEDAQISELDQSGQIIFQWQGKNIIDKLSRANSVAANQPKSYTATTSAVKTSAGNYYLSMAQKDLIIKINKSGEVISKLDVSTRPHTLVVDGDDLIGYSARSPNRLMLMNADCHCFKKVVVNEAMPGKSSTRSLSLQYLGKGLWFTSGVTGLYILNDEGKIFWKLEHEGLRGRPIGFHAAVIYDH